MSSTARIVILIAAQLGLLQEVIGTSVAAEVRQGRGLSFLRRGRDISDDDSDLPLCSCNCCNVAARRPDEVSTGVLVKCSANSEHSSEVCQSRCVASSNDHILSYASGQVLDQQRFCFFECKPAEGKHSPIHTQCIDLEDEEAKQVVDGNGDALDPAFLYEQAAAQSSRREVLLGKVSAPAPGPAMSAQAAGGIASQATNLSIASGSEALAVAKQLQENEEAEAAKLNARLASGKDPAAPAALNADMHDAAETSEAAAAAATRAAKEAADALQQARDSAWTQAQRAADEEVDRLRREAAAKVHALTNPPKTLRERAAAAAADASMPFLRQASNMQAVVQQYNETAFQLNEEGVQELQKATALRMEAQELRDKFHITGSAVNLHDWDKLIASRKADLLLSEAKAHLMQAKFVSKQHNKVLGRMNYLEKSIPVYNQYAKSVAVSAAYNSNPAWAPLGYASR
mmetsp:Transcript_16047/g.36805  ORF Transcript_16047/g.36805 Transcript_16047/m.36805 type:complete len:459 (-) Transcript_16047:15-1391(-)